MAIWIPKPGELERARDDERASELRSLREERDSARAEAHAARVEAHRLRDLHAKAIGEACIAEKALDDIRAVVAERDALRAVLLPIVNDADVWASDEGWRCGMCGKPATCFGGYAGCHDTLRFACDECCGHWQEDGWCVTVEALRDALGGEK